jgi:thiamine phosphate synthase YjbQ (UPF0047 family)
MQKVICILNSCQHGLNDIPSKVAEIVQETNGQYGMVNVYVRGAMAGIMIHFNYICPVFRFSRYNSGIV